MHDKIKTAGWLLCLCSLLAVSACAHGDHSLNGQSAALLERTLVIGTTTEDQARGLFGKPSITAKTDGQDSWLYNLAREDVSPASLMPVIQFLYMQDSRNHQSLRLTFDSQDRLLRWSYLETNQNNYRGL